ncbi:MAG TPA: hypothetical protein VG936_07255 [Lacunisphaera sp.]|nr:hypothetical protein [Lacunisphaera sp.]
MLEDFALEPEMSNGAAAGSSADETSASLARLRRRITVRGEVTLVVPPHLMLLKMIKAPPVGTGRREDIVRYEASQGIPGDPAGIVSGYLDAGARGGEPEVVLTAAKLADVESLCAAAEAADFTPSRLLPSPVGTLAAFRHSIPAGSRATLLLDIGTRSTTLLLVEPEGFFARILSFGVAAREGEGSSGSGKTGSVDLGTNALVTRLAQEIVRTLLHLSRRGATARPQSLVVAGFAAGGPGLARSLGSRLELTVDPFEPHQAIEYSPVAIRNGAREAVQNFPGLAGAALHLLQDQTEINLLPPLRKREWQARLRHPWLVGAGVMILLALWPPIIHWRSLADEANRKAMLMERAVAPVRERDTRIRMALRDLARVEIQLASLHDAWDRRGRWLEFLADLQDRLIRVGDVWLDRLEVVPAAGSTPQKLLLAGRMLDRDHPLGNAGPETIARVKALIASMHESPFVHGVEDERFDRSRPGVLSFNFVLVAESRQPL